jgi:hypothetical protein
VAKIEGCVAKMRKTVAKSANLLEKKNVSSESLDSLATSLGSNLPEVESSAKSLVSSESVEI